MAKDTIYIRERCYIPENLLDLSRVETLFTRTCFDEGRCNTCEWYNSRPCDMCEDCPAYLGTYTLYNQKTVQGVDYIGLPLGARTKIRKLVPNLKDVPKRDLRCVTKFRYDIEFTGDLRDHQREAVDALKKSGYGVLKAPPRSGKTVMFIALAIELGYKTLILANQYDFLQQFYETLCGSATQESLTNIPDIEKFSGVKICGIANKLEDYFKYDICLSTYQTFISEMGQKRFARIKGLFGTVGVDEVHKGNATHFAKVLSNLHPKYKYGLTATPERKDGRSFLVDHIIGPVTHEVEIKRLRPEVKFIETGFSKEYKIWVYAMRGLEKSEARNELIVDNVFKQLKEGHSIVIPLCFRSHIDTIVEMINSRARRKIAEPFHGGQSKEQRTAIIIAARKGKVKVVVGMRQMIQLGINVPKWSAIFEVIPISNPPNHEQEVSRILTPMEGKPRPLILYFIDNNGAGKGCLRTCVFKTHVPLGHYISKAQWDLVGPYLRRRRAYDGEDDTPQMKRGRKSDIGKPSNRKTLLTKAGKRVL